MIIEVAPSHKRIETIDKQIEAIARGKLNRLVKDTTDEIERIANRLSYARKSMRSICIEHPEMDDFLKRQINELDKLIDRMEKAIE